MHATDFNACTYDGAVYCNECLPVPVDNPNVYPIFADQEWDYASVCDKCGTEHDYMNIIKPAEDKSKDSFFAPCKLCDIPENDPGCPATHGLLQCTRELGHPGDHTACGLGNQHPGFTWTQS